MSRILSLAVLSFLLPLRADAAPKPDKEKPLYVRLQERVNTNGLEDPKTSLAEVLEQYAKQFDLPLVINDKAFQEENVQSVVKTEIVATEPIPPMKNARIETVLQRILSRVPVDGGATYTIRRDRIEITTVKAQRAEFWPQSTEESTFFPLVQADFEKTPLDTALKELADASEVTIVLDVRALEKEMPAVTARLANTPLDSAVIILAEMTDLRSIRMGKTIFVTSVKKAEALDKRLNPSLVNPFGGLGGVLPGGVPLPLVPGAKPGGM